jgi:mycothiol system anti-sigma-R factor
MAEHDEHEHQHLDLSPDCSAVLAEIYTYLDGELTDEGRTRIASHLGDCNPCLEIFDFEAELRIVVAHRCHDEVPTQLRVRVEQALLRVTVEEGAADQAEPPPA